jgi:hypothetical protein
MEALIVLAAMVRRERTNQMPKKKNVAEATPEAETTNETVIETQPEAATATEPAPEAEPPKKKGKKKAKVPSGTATLADIAAGYLAHMEEAGKSEGTTSSYRMELKTAMDELGETTPVADITVQRVQEYFDSRRVTKLRSGKNKAKPSVDKTRRVLRLALCWAAERGIIEKAPIPEPEPAK